MSEVSKHSHRISSRLYIRYTRDTQDTRDTRYTRDTRDTRGIIRLYTRGTNSFHLPCLYKAKDAHPLERHTRHTQSPYAALLIMIVPTRQWLGHSSTCTIGSFPTIHTMMEEGGFIFRAKKNPRAPPPQKKRKQKWWGRGGWARQTLFLINREGGGGEAI